MCQVFVSPKTNWCVLDKYVIPTRLIMKLCTMYSVLQFTIFLCIILCEFVCICTCIHQCFDSSWSTSDFQTIDCVCKFRLYLSSKMSKNNEASSIKIHSNSCISCPGTGCNISHRHLWRYTRQKIIFSSAPGWNTSVFSKWMTVILDWMAYTHRKQLFNCIGFFLLTRYIMNTTEYLKYLL